MESDNFDLGADHGTGFEDGDVPMKVTGGSYRQFNRWMNRELAKLACRWEHLAAPAARNAFRRSRQARRDKPIPR